MPDSDSPLPPARSARTWSLGWRISLLIHFGLIALLLWIPWHFWSNRTTDQKRPAAAATAGSAKPATTGEPKRDIQKHAEKLAAEDVQRKMEEMLKAAQELPPEKLEQRLEAAGKQLASVSSPENVTEISQKMQTWMGTQTRQSSPAKTPVAGDFDHGTGQIDTVRKLKDAEGRVRYVAVLVDSAGRTMDIPLPQEDGESLHRLFQLMQANPLLDQVYRQMAMPMLDQLLKGTNPAPAAPPDGETKATGEAGPAGKAEPASKAEPTVKAPSPGEEKPVGEAEPDAAAALPAPAAP